MIPVLTKEQAYKLDKDTIESGHLSQEELMDNAGKAVAQFFCEKIQNPLIKDEIKVLTNNAFKKDIFGAPTFVVNNKIFWGQDRLDYALDEYSS